MIGLILFGTFALLLFLGVPIAMSLGAAALLGLFYMDIPLAVEAQRIFTALDSGAIMAIPFFVLAGNLMTEGGISKRLVDFANCIIGNVRGGMGYAMVMACAFFAALSGSAPATVIAIGAMLYPQMVKLGYPKARCAGLLAVAGGLGPIIPPSIIMVVYATLTNASVGNMFSAGIVSGAMIVAVLVIISAFLARKEKWPKNDYPFSMGNFLTSTFKAIPAIFLPVLILGGIYSGLLTPTESAAVAVVYSFIIGKFVYKAIDWKDVGKIIMTSAKGSAMVLFIVATSSSFSWIFTVSGLSKDLVLFIKALEMSPTMFCLVVAVVLLIFGMFLEGIATAVLMVPLLWPIADSLGINIIHFGMIVCLSNVIGTMTPPVAVNLFAAQSITGLRMGEIAKGEMPFFIGYNLVFLCVVLFPWFSTFFLN